MHKAASGLMGIFMVVGLSACSTVSRIPGVSAVIGEDGLLRDRSGAYLEASSIPRTDVPPGLDSYMIDDLYVIPDVPGSDDYFRAPPRPRGLEGRSDRQVVIQRIDDSSWIVVGLSPGQVWPRITDYWAQNRVPMVNENPTQGTMDTVWFGLESRPGERQKFRVMIEPGFQDNSAEVRLRNLAVSDEGPPPGQNVDFPAVSTHPEIETEFLRDMSEFLADVAGIYQASTVSFLAGNISSDGKASLRDGADGKRFLHLNTTYTRAWGAIGLTLDRIEVDVIDRDVDAGIYEVTFVPEEGEDEPGFFYKLFTFNWGRPEYTMRIRLQEEDGAVRVDVEKTDDTPVRRNAPDPEEALLLALRNYIA